MPSKSMLFCQGGLQFLQHLTSMMLTTRRQEALQILRDLPMPASSPALQRALQQYNWALLLSEAGQLDKAVSHAKAALETSSSAAAAERATAVNGVAVMLAASAKEVTTCCLLLLALLMSARCGVSYACACTHAEPASRMHYLGT